MLKYVKSTSGSRVDDVLMLDDDVLIEDVLIELLDVLMLDEEVLTELVEIEEILD